MNPSQPIPFDSDAKARMVAALVVAGLIAGAFVSNLQPPHPASPQPLITTQSAPATLENEPVRSFTFPGARPESPPTASFPGIGRSVDLFDSRVPPPII